MTEKKVKLKNKSQHKKAIVLPEFEKNDERKSHIPFRLNFLFFIVFALFVALLVQLSYLQVANGSYFEAKIENSQKRIVEGNAPRGMIYDAKGRALVSNQANQAIIYTKKEGLKADEIADISKKIVDLIEIEPDKLSERDKKDYWLAAPSNLKSAQERLSSKEQLDEKGQKLSNSDIYSKTVDKVTEAEVNFDVNALEEASVFKRINGAYSLTPVFIKNRNVTKEEIAIIGENTTELPGISTGMDWERDYPQGDIMRSILGTVSSEKTGLPEEEAESYLAKGYARNDRVGLSYLEKQYEPVLKGTKSQSELIVNKETNEVEKETKVFEGEKGKNLVLTLDIDFQQEIVNILKNNYQILQNNGKATLSEGIYAVVMNPKTGEVLAMAGLDRDKDTGELTDDTLGTINKAFVPGSAIKPATIMAGYRNNVISGNQVLMDEAIQIASSPKKTSVFNSYGGRVPVSTIDALRVSSNVYMMQIAFLLMGESYVPGMTLGDHTNVFETLRKTYRDFGLGAETGIDLPGESYGLSPTNHYEEDGTLIAGRMGNLLDLSYGNFDTYTPMQLAQFISTIANDGKKVAPHVVKGVFNNDINGNLGELEKLKDPTVLTEIGTRDQLDIIQEGLSQVVSGGGTGARMAGTTKYSLSAKTGTAEVPIPNKADPTKSIDLINSTMVAYSPSEDPEIAISLIIDHITDERDALNTKITSEIINAYFQFFEK